MVRSKGCVPFIFDLSCAQGYLNQQYEEASLEVWEGHIMLLSS